MDALLTEGDFSESLVPLEQPPAVTIATTANKAIGDHFIAG